LSWRPLAITLVVALAALAILAILLSLDGDSEEQADLVSTPVRLEELVGPLEEDDAKPRVNGIFGEIAIYSYGRGPDYPCPEDLDLLRGYEPAKETALRIEPAYLPKDAHEQERGGAGACQGTIVGTARTWFTPGPVSAEISIRRSLLPEPWVSADAPADRISTRWVAGHVAAVIRHVVQVGDQVRGNSGVFWADRRSDGLYVVTAVYGEQITLDELIKVAEGLE
jgi:hypothetical protein